ncbi:MAG: serine/threonine protein kinase [Sulfolobaceae archaeon]|nr:serine/threonine protein kinase [Sulfolobaceae archaeon]
MVEVKKFIYPFFSEEIYKELIEHGIRYLYSFGDIRVGEVYVIGKGKTGIVALLDENRVIKIRRSDSPKESLEIEAKIQDLAYPIAPRVYSYGKNFIIMDYVKGRSLTKNENIDVIKKLLIKAKGLEDKRIEHKELSRPYKNVIVTENDVYIIDYDSASIKEKPKNVSSILSWFKRSDLAKLYLKGVPLDVILQLLEKSSS